MSMTYKGLELKTIEDHPKVKLIEGEGERIQKAFNVYSGKVEQLTFKNSYGDEVKRNKYTINMLKEVSSYLSKIIFNEGCKISSSEKYSQFLEKILKESNFVSDLSNFLEPAVATGGLLAKPVVKQDGSIKIVWCLANTIYPTVVDNTHLKGVAIASKVVDSDGENFTYYTLLEFHEWSDEGYVIEHELYESKRNDKTGKQVPLETYYPELSEKVVIKGLKTPLFNYFKPKGFNNISPHSPLGLGICDNAMDTIELINEVYDKFYLDVHTSGRKVIVPDDFIKTSIDFSDGSVKRYFDEDESVFVGLPLGLENSGIKDVSNALRTGDYITAINKAISTLEMQTGLSGGTFTFDKNGIKTATEVVSENSLTYQTRGEHLEELERFIKDVIISTFNLASAVVRADGSRAYTGEIPTYEDISIDFQDGVFTDKKAQLEFIKECLVLNIIPKVEAITRLFDITEEQAKAWLENINTETMNSNIDYRLSKEEFSLFGSGEEG